MWIQFPINDPFSGGWNPSKCRGGGTGCAGCAIAHPLFYDFHKLSVEKEILKIGQDLTELEVKV